MLIDGGIVKQFMVDNNIDVTGILHIGAHECEEFAFYKDSLNVPPENMVWIDAIPAKVELNTSRGIPNVYHAVITDVDDDTVNFHLANNGQSSSILELNTHAYQYPDIVYVDNVVQKTVTIDSFFERNGLDPSKYVFWNFDIQGAELLALLGAKNTLQHAKILYLEVNQDELYKNCGLITEVDEYLKARGFTREHTLMTVYGWGDAIYIRK